MEARVSHAESVTGPGLMPKKPPREPDPEDYSLGKGRSARVAAHVRGLLDVRDEKQLSFAEKVGIYPGHLSDLVS